MIQKLSESRGWQLLIATALILIVPLMVDVNGRMSTTRRMRQQQARLEQQLTEAREERQALEAQLEYVKSDDYLERWARVDARMTRPGEVALIPLSDEPARPDALLSQDNPNPFPPDISPSTSEQWHNLFFDDTANP